MCARACVSVHVYACACVSVHVYARACVCACVRVSVCICILHVLIRKRCLLAQQTLTFAFEPDSVEAWTHRLETMRALLLTCLATKMRHVAQLTHV